MSFLLALKCRPQITETQDRQALVIDLLALEFLIQLLLYLDQLPLGLHPRNFTVPNSLQPSLRYLHQTAEFVEYFGALYNKFVEAIAIRFQALSSAISIFLARSAASRRTKSTARYAGAVNIFSCFEYSRNSTSLAPGISGTVNQPQIQFLRLEFPPPVYSVHQARWHNNAGIAY